MVYIGNTIEYENYSVIRLILNSSQFAVIHPNNNINFIIILLTRSAVELFDIKHGSK